MKNKLEEFRKKNNISQERLAFDLKISRQTISSLENGRYNPSIELAFKLAKYFSVLIEDLFIFDDNNGGNIC